MRFLSAWRAGMVMALGATSLGAFVACTTEEESGAEASTQEQNEREDLFDKSTVLSMKVSAPMGTLFDRYKRNAADPPRPDAAPGQPEFSEAGTMTVPDSDGRGTAKTFDVRVYIRGESSRHDCPFPKLKIELSNKDQLKGTLFKGHSKFRLNTHCGPGGTDARSGMGRIQNGIGPVREDLVYRLIRAADVPTYLTRVTNITYADTAANTSIDTQAMIIEAGDDAAQRFAKTDPPLIDPDGGAYLDPNNGEARGQTTPENNAKITVVEALAGNQDFWVGGTHNLDSFGIPNAPTIFKIPEDFDLCAITLAGDPRWSGPVANASQGLRTAGIAAHFAKHKADMVAAIDKAEKEGVEAKTLPSTDGATTTDPGFKTARERVEQLFALPELAGGAGGANDGG